MVLRLGPNCSFHAMHTVQWLLATWPFQRWRYFLMTTPPVLRLVRRAGTNSRSGFFPSCCDLFVLLVVRGQAEC